MTNSEIKIVRSTEEIKARIEELKERWLIYSASWNAQECARERTSTFRAIEELAWVLGQKEPD